MDSHTEVVGIEHKNIYVEYKLKTSNSKWESPPMMEENDWDKILWAFQIQTNKMVMANHVMA